MIKIFKKNVNGHIENYFRQRYTIFFESTTFKEKKMKIEMWRNPVKELAPDARGCYVTIWSGYRWEYFAGPFSNQDDAEWAVLQWKQRFDVGLDSCFRYELSDGKK